MILLTALSQRDAGDQIPLNVLGIMPISSLALFIMQAFVKYVLGFYGRGGIYDMGATRSMVCDIINTYLVGDVWVVPDHPYGTLSFGYDSTDRELIRDLLISDYSLAFPD